MIDLRCDIAVIGAGTAGLAAERSARAAGADTLLIDDRFAGTTCASVGCMPSKLLIAAGNAAHAVRTADRFGLGAMAPIIDGRAVLARVRVERDRFVAGVISSFDDLPAGVRIEGRARFVDRSVLALDDGRRIHARAIVIATGASPIVPDLFDPVRACVLTNETLFELADLPRSIGVIGAGPLGLELAQALARLGVETMVFDRGETIGGLHDAAVASDLHTILQRELPILLGVDLAVEPDEGGVRVLWHGKATGEKRFERLLVATGRAPQVTGLGLDRTGLALDGHGVPLFDRQTMQCGDSSIFVAGDADGDRPVLHEASAEGAIAGRNAAGFPDVSASRRMVPFAIMFTDPQVAVIGDVPAGDAAGHVVGRASYAEQGRATVEARNAGLVHLYADAADGRLTGATMAGPGVEHSAHLIAWAVQDGRTATELLDRPFYHPTLEEGLRSALAAICHAVHAPSPPDRDSGALPGA